jgi:hypothetical protein
MHSGSVGPVREPSVHSFASPVTQSPSAEASSPSTPEAPSAFAMVLQGIGREVQHGESLVRSALSAARGGVGASNGAGGTNGTNGGSMGPGELIALQAGVYRYGEAVDLASRLVDRATSSVKTVLQGQ